MNRFRKTQFVVAFATLTLCAVSVSQAFPPYQAPQYDNRSDDNLPFYENGLYDESIPKPAGSVARQVDARPLRIHEIHQYFTALANSSPRAHLVEYGRTYENRPLIYLVISSEETMAKLDQIKTNQAALANPGKPYFGSRVMDIIKSSPAVAWMAYSIHGDEISGSDAAVEVAYHLIASDDDFTRALRDSLVIIIDPSQNPDGRERYLTMLQSHYSQVASTDAQSLQHGGFWPWGRGNHYLFDLNRDWILLENAETKGKVSAILEWNPQMLVDAHEMGAYSTFLFNPPREPINRNIPDTIVSWWQTYSLDHAAAFDAYGWSYYTREWHEEWYPGYGSAWAGYVGAVGLLYEQSGADGMPTKQRNGYVQTYREAVMHQFVSSLANLKTTADNRAELLKGFYQIKVDAIEAGAKDSPRHFVIPTQPYPHRADKLAETLLGMGIDVRRISKGGSISGAHDVYGQRHRNLRIPAGSYLVSLDQPLRPLIKGIMEFDPHLSGEFLIEERRELEKWGESRLYEFSSWSLSLAYDLGVVWTDSKISLASDAISSVAPRVGELRNAESAYGWVIDYRSDQAPLAALRLLAAGYKVQAAERPFRVNGQDYCAGSLIIRRRYNDPGAQDFLAELSKELGIVIDGARSARVESGSDLGADSFRNLELPRIGLFGGPNVSYTSYGSIWHQLDQELEIRHSLLNLSELNSYDLDRYNVLIIPSIWGGPTALKKTIGSSGSTTLSEWASNGGTLILIGSAAAWAADSASGLSSVRLRRNSLEKLDEYDTVNSYELFSSTPVVDTAQLWNYNKPKPSANKKNDSDSEPDIEALKRQDKRTRTLFIPRGTVFNVLLDNERWPAFGCGERVPAGLYTGYAFMSKEPAQTVGRIEDAESCRLGGLLWPEARERWANTAYLTRESKGKGQVILFAGDPDFRGYWKGTARLFTNILALGPGFGSQVSVGW